jgi:hypothetical protein
MVKEILIPKENKAQIEEVREIETNQLTEKDFFIGCPDEDGVREGTKKAVQGEVGVTTAINAPTGAIMGAITKPVGKAVEGIGEATGSEEVKGAGKGTQDAAEEPLDKVGEGIKGGLKALDDKIDSLFE